MIFCSLLLLTRGRSTFCPGWYVVGDSVTLYFPDCCHGVEEVICCNV